MALNDFLDNLIKKSFDLDKFKSLLEAETHDGDVNDSAEIIAEDYYQLIKSVLKIKKLNNVTLNRDDILTVNIDGTEYCFDELVRHNNFKNTERIMEIEALFADGVSYDEVQDCLNSKILSVQSEQDESKRST